MKKEKFKLGFDTSEMSRGELEEEIYHTHKDLNECYQKKRKPEEESGSSNMMLWGFGVLGLLFLSSK